jgi:hypothetical protein
MLTASDASDVPTVIDMTPLAVRVIASQRCCWRDPDQ